MVGYERVVFSKDSSTEILLITDTQQEQFQKYYQTQDKRFHMLSPGVSRDRARGDAWQDERARIRREIGVGEDEHLLLLIGSGFITKGLDRALRVLASLPGEVGRHTRFLVIGQDNPQGFVRQARKLGVAEQLIVRKGRNDIPSILQAADLMVHPAYMESGGLVLIEAIIAGLPVVATAVCGFAHYIEQANAGVVIPEPFIQAEMDRVVVEALEDSQCRRRWSENGVAFGRTRNDLYDMPANALREIEHYVSKQNRHGAR